MNKRFRLSLAFKAMFVPALLLSQQSCSNEPIRSNSTKIVTPKNPESSPASDSTTNTVQAKPAEKTGGEGATVGAYPFHETFSANLQANWDILSGEPTVQEKALLLSKEVITTALAKGAPLENSIVEAKIEVSGDKHSAGLVSRYSKDEAGIESMYLALLVLRGDVAFVELWRQSGASLTEMSSKVLATDTATNLSKHLRLVSSANTFTVTVDDQVMIQEKDEVIPKAGRQGIRAFATDSRISNFSIYEGENPKASLPFSSSFRLPDLQSPLAPWLLTAGTIGVKSEKVYGSHATATSVALLDGIKTANIKIQGSVKLPDSTTDSLAGLVARHQGPGDQNMIVGLLARTSGKLSVSIFSATGATWTKLASKEVTETEGILTFEVSGAKLRLTFSQGTQKTQVETTVAQFVLSGSVGSVGVRLSPQATMDDFSVAPVGLM